MSTQSIIEHKANMYYVEFREDYLLICQQIAYKKPLSDGQKCKSSPYCEALILAVLESWTNDKKGKGKDLSVYMTYPQWINAMYGIFGRSTIIDSLDVLLGEGLISKEAHRMFGKDTYKYFLNAAEINKRMRNLKERDANSTRPQVDASISKRVASISKPVTRPQVDAYPSTSRRNIDTTNNLNLDTTQNTEESDGSIEPITHTHNSLQEAISLLVSQGYQITLENAHPLPTVGDTPLTLAGQTMTPPPAEVAITPLAAEKTTITQDESSTSHPITAGSENIAQTGKNGVVGEIVSNDTMLAGFASEPQIETPVEVSSVKGGNSSKRGKAKETSSLPPVLDFKAKRAQKVKPAVSEEELALRQEVHAWIDQRRGYKLYGRATTKQVIEENTAVITLAHMVYLAQYESNVEDGGTWDELKFTWDTIEKSDKFWSKPENKGRIGAQAILQMFAPTVQDRRKKQQRLATVGVSSVPQRQESDLERKNRLLHEKYGKRA